MMSDLCEVHGLHPEKLERVRGKMPGEDIFAKLADIFKALGDPTRSLTGMSSSAISHQLRLLRASRLVRYRRDGKMAFYSLDDDHVRHLLAEGLCHACE